MRKEIKKVIAKSHNLNEIIEALLLLLLTTKKENKKVGYVAGTIFSEGPEFVERNIKRLEEYTERLKKEYDFPLFSCVDIFYDDKFYEKLDEVRLPYVEKRKVFIEFYRKMLMSGLVTDIFMTPGWEKSEGATDEHKTSKKHNITIHYVTTA